MAIGVFYALQGPFYALLFYLGNAYFRPEDWVWGDFVRSLRLSLVIGVYVLITTLFSSQKRWVWDSRVALLVVFFALSLVSTIVSDYSEYAWPYLVEFAKVLLITYVIIILTTDFAKLRQVILVIVMALGLEQAKQGWAHLLTSPGSANTNELPFFGDNNGVAVGMIMFLPLVGILIQTTHNKWAKRFYGFIFIGCLYRALTTYSRGGFLAACAMGAVWWLHSNAKAKGLAVTILLLAIIVPALPETFWDRMDTIPRYGETIEERSALSRTHFWDVATKMAMENPILGVGFNSFNRAYDRYDYSAGAYGKGRSVHSIFFGVLAELGFVGFLIYIGLIVGAYTACRQANKLARLSRDLNNLGHVGVALQSSLTAYVVGGMFVPLQYNEMFWHLIGLSIVLRNLALKYQRRESPLAEPSIPSLRLTAVNS